MALKDMFYNVFKSLNPESYEELTQRPTYHAIKYFFFVCVLTLFFMFIILIPAIFSFSNNWGDTVSNFNVLDLNVSFQLKQSFYLSEDPVIRVEQSGSNITGSRILISQDGIFYKSYFFFGEKKFVPLSQSYVEDDSNISKLFIFLLPSIAFWTMIFFMVYFVIIILISALLCGMIAAIIGLRIKFSKILKISIYASTILILVQLLLIPFFRTFIIPIIAYWLLLAIIIFVFRDEREPHQDNVFKSSKKNVFSKNEDGEEPAIKKNKKHNFEKENEGYVEWK